MKSENRWTGIVAMAVALACGLAGCGAQPTPGPAAAPTAPRPTATLAPTPKAAAIGSLDPAGEEIVLWHPWLDEEEEALWRLVSEFNSRNEWGITVRVANQGDLPAIERKTWTAIGAGRPPDLIVAGQDAVARLAAAGAVQALDEYVSHRKYGLARDELHSTFLAGDRYPAFDDRLLSWPLVRDLYVLYYNADWLEGLGYDGPPRTWVDFQAMCRGATGTRKKTATFGYALTAEASTFAGWLYGAGGRLLTGDGRTVAFDRSPGVEAMAALQNVLHDGVAYVVTERGGQQHDFVGQQALFVLDSTASLPSYARAITDTETGRPRFNWSVASLPHDTPDPVVPLSGPSLAVLETTPERQLAAWLFLRWWTEPAAAGRWAAATNAFPLHRAALTTEAFQARLEAIPQYEAASTLLDYGQAAPAVAGQSEVWATLDRATLAIADGQDVKTTLDTAASRAKFDLRWCSASPQVKLHLRRSTMLQTAIEASHAAGQILMERLRGPRNITVKGVRDIVTDADLAAERAIVECLQARFPDHGILTEEAGLDDARHSEYLWIVDPLDGTTNYSRRHPCFSTAIGLSHRGRMVLGVVYDPLNDRLFQARRGDGATLNGLPLHVSHTDTLNATIAALDWAHRQEDRERIVHILARVAPQVGTLRTLGSAALAVCYVAAGWVDAYFHLSLSAWDVAAAGLIAEEAGGTVTGHDGRPWQLDTTRLLVSNGWIHEGLLALIKTSMTNYQ